MQIGVEGLLAREISKGTEVIKSRQVRLQLTAKEKEKLQDLGLQRDKLNAKLQEETERHRQLVARWGEEGLAVKTHAADMAILREKIDDTTQAIAGLENKQGKLATVTEKVRRALVASLVAGFVHVREPGIQRPLRPWVSAVGGFAIVGPLLRPRYAMVGIANPRPPRRLPVGHHRSFGSVVVAELLQLRRYVEMLFSSTVHADIVRGEVLGQRRLRLAARRANSFSCIWCWCWFRY
jgi:hypothetical protein